MGYYGSNSSYNQRYGRGYNDNYGQGYGQNYGRPRKKRSGCKMKNVTKQGEAKLVIWGWNINKRHGFRTFVAVPARKGDTEGTSASGRQWQRMVVTVQPEGAQQFLTSGFWYPAEQKLRMPELRMTASPTTRYWGTNQVRGR
jgi:hypothetical protein